MTHVLDRLVEEDQDARAHMDAYLDFWCAQLERKVRHYEAVDRRKLQNDDEWDRKNGDLNA